MLKNTERWSRFQLFKSGYQKFQDISASGIVELLTRSYTDNQTLDEDAIVMHVHVGHRIVDRQFSNVREGTTWNSTHGPATTVRAEAMYFTLFIFCFLTGDALYVGHVFYVVHVFYVGHLKS